MKVKITAEDTSTVLTYTVTITRAEEDTSLRPTASDPVAANPSTAVYGGVEGHGNALLLQHLTPIPRGSSLAALSAWLQREVDRLAAPRVRERFAAQRPLLRPEPGVAFEARRMRAVSGSRSALVRRGGLVWSPTSTSVTPFPGTLLKQVPHHAAGPATRPLGECESKLGTGSHGIQCRRSGHHVGLADRSGPHRNGCVERVQGTILKEGWKPSFARHLGDRTVWFSAASPLSALSAGGQLLLTTSGMTAGRPSANSSRKAAFTKSGAPRM